MNEKMASKILRTLPREKAFYFFTSFGNYTGEHASSLKEFIDKIDEVNEKSLEFHFYRRDFEKWIAEVLEDEELSRQIDIFRNSSPIGKNLKDGLQRILTMRYSELKMLL